MQLIRLNTGPSGRRGNGLFVVLLSEVAERADTRASSSDVGDQLDGASHLTHSYVALADASH
ncbi:MAG TPA: hypothetical protein VHQ23_04450 [Ilumatobacteraceae bacterium]|jgi:hypothetical protein|nr:hypothetical protein [Ilumatobacteraceae bacterium]